MILQRCGLIYLGCWLIIAIQTWVSMRWPSFVVASAVGITFTVAGIMVVQSDWGSFYPWALPGLLINQLGKGDAYTAELLFGSLGGIVAALIGGWDVTRRDILS
jgi:ABC-2 type transport system permease protein